MSLFLFHHLLSFFLQAAPNPSPIQGPLRIELSFPYKNQLFPPCSDSSLMAKVYFINQTDTVVSFFEEWNSWGYFNLSFEITTDSFRYTVRPIDTDWNKNFPSYYSLFPGDTAVHYYNLSSSPCQWTRFTGIIPHPGEGLRSIKYLYKLDKEVWEFASLEGRTIQYKFKSNDVLESDQRNSVGRRRKGSSDRKIVDSLPSPIPVNRTFPLIQLASNEVRFDKLH